MTSTGCDDCLHPSRKRFVELLKYSAETCRQTFLAIFFCPAIEVTIEKIFLILTLWLRASLLNATIAPLSLWGTSLPPGIMKKCKKKNLNLQKKSAKMRARTNMLPEKETRIFCLFRKQPLIFKLMSFPNG